MWQEEAGEEAAEAEAPAIPEVERTPLDTLTQQIRQARPDITDDQVQMYIDAMSLDKDTFKLYAGKLGFANPDDLAEEYFRWHKEKTRAEVRARLRKEESLTLHVDDKPTWMATIADEQITVSERGMYGDTFADVQGRLAEHGIRIDILNNAPERDVWAYMSKLAHLLDDNPVLRQVADGDLQGIVFKDYPATHKAPLADYDPLQKVINVYPVGSAETGYRERTTSVLVHEMGHSAEDMFAPDLSEMGLFGEPGTRVVSQYGHNAYDEDWAETFTALVGKWQTQAVKEWVPEKYRYMIEHIPGLREWIEP